MEELKPCPSCECVEKKDEVYSFGEDLPGGDGNIALCLRHSSDGYTLHAESIGHDDDGSEYCESDDNASINFCPHCGRPLIRRAAPENPRRKSGTESAKNGSVPAPDGGGNKPRTITLPCKVGDAVYSIGTGEIVESRVRTFWMGEIGGLPHLLMIRTTRYDLDADQIGKTVFLTREATEQALAARHPEDAP